MRLSPKEIKKIKEIAKDRGLSENEVMSIIYSPYQFMKVKTSRLIFEDNLTKEEFNRKKTNFNIPGIGKLYSSYYLYKLIQSSKNKNKK